MCFVCVVLCGVVCACVVVFVRRFECDCVCCLVWVLLIGWFLFMCVFLKCVCALFKAYCVLYVCLDCCLMLCVC